MNPSRREFLAAASIGAGAFALTARAGAVDEPTWLTYAVNIELFWSKLPLLDRLKKVAEAGFGHYEFGNFKTKDVLAIDKASKELNLNPVQFTAYAGIANPKRKDMFLEAIDDAIEVADAMGVKKLTVVAGEVVKDMERDAMIDAVVDALKGAAEKAKEHEITILLEPINAEVARPSQLIGTMKDAAEVVDAVGSPGVKILFDVYHQQVSEGDLLKNIKMYFDKIGYFQVADHPGRSQPGTGKIDFPPLLRLIHDLGYKEAIGLEMKPKGDPLEALKQLREVDAAAKALG